MGKIFVGHDWAEEHHDVHVCDAEGKKLGYARLGAGVEGVARFHELVAPFVTDPAEVLIATETDRGLFIGALAAAGYQVLAINPLSTSHYRQRHSISGAKSDPGDAFVLAELARTDGHNHRVLVADSDAADAVKALARGHQSLIWGRTRHVFQLRAVLVEFYPAALEAFESLASIDALAVLAIAPTPQLGAKASLSKIAAALRRGGRSRLVEERAAPIQAALRAEHLTTAPLVAEAMGATVVALVGVIGEFNKQIAVLEAQVAASFEQHPDAKIILSLPGLGMILGARVLAEFGDAPNRYATAKCRKNYAGTSPITRASGKSKVVVARYIRNRRLIDACDGWAFSALKTSPGARAFYDQHKAAGANHHAALRTLANRLVGILHGCLEHQTPYDEHLAWGHRKGIAA
jgi:transposase